MSTNKSQPAQSQHADTADSATDPANAKAAQLQSFAVSVDNLPGVLNRVSSLIRNRGHNVLSLNVGPTQSPEHALMTVVVKCDDAEATRLHSTLYKLVNVLDVQKFSQEESKMRSLTLFRVQFEAEQAQALEGVCQKAGARLLEDGGDSRLYEFTGTSPEQEALLQALAPYDLAQLAQSGPVAMARPGVSYSNPMSDSQRAVSRRFTAA